MTGNINMKRAVSPGSRWGFTMHLAPGHPTDHEPENDEEGAQLSNSFVTWETNDLVVPRVKKHLFPCRKIGVYSWQFSSGRKICSYDASSTRVTRSLQGDIHRPAPCTSQTLLTSQWDSFPQRICGKNLAHLDFKWTLG